ncbi:MAG: gamma carbonic anhydrase family protein [Hyphomicrobiaceae bacterium]|nr:MAG: gamma carbonic anhydrase family protein [Hyphomicrobiaceae bacterium]
MKAPPNRSVFPLAAYIDPTARTAGEVEIGEGSSLWPYAVIRAESHFVRIGRFSNLQDHVMVHIGYHTPTIVGDYCSITHRVVLHGCTVGDNCLIGIGATLMDGVVLGENSIVAGHSFLREGTVIPPNSIVMGTPAKVVRTENSFVANRVNAMLYHRNAVCYARGDHRGWDGPEYEVQMAAWKAEIEREFERLYGGKPPSA